MSDFEGRRTGYVIRMNVDPPSSNATWQHLRRFAESGCDVSFRALFDSHAGLVYRAALRTGRGDRHLAEDVVQTVFTSLARKASTFSPRIILPAWLHRHACLTTLQMMRSARRRQAREEASAVLRQEPGGSACHIAEVIDEALNSLPNPDRAALALRFLENKDLRSVGRELGVSEDAAQKRVSRGLDRLRVALERRGVTRISTLTAGTLLSESAGATLPNLSALAAASLRAASATTAAFPAGAGFLAFLTMKTSTIVTASILAVLAGTAVLTMTHWSQPTPTNASAKPAPVRSSTASKAPHRLEISTTKGPRVPRTRAPSKPAPEYDAATKEAFKNHPMTRIVQDRINAMRSVTQSLLNKMSADHKDKLALYQELQTAGTTPGTSDAGRAAAKAQMETLSVQIREIEQEQADFKTAMNEMLNRNLTDSTQLILAEIKNPSPPARQPTPQETSSFHTADALFLKRDYAAAESMFTPLANSADPQVAAFSRWKVMLTRIILGKDNSHEIQPLLLGSTSSACYAMAAYAVQQGGWEEANLWINKAKNSGVREENAIFNDPLLEMGWMDPETGLLIPPDPLERQPGKGK